MKFLLGALIYFAFLFFFYCIFKVGGEGGRFDD